MFQPFKLAPAFQDYLWGGQRLKIKYGKQVATDTLAESWEVSTHPDGIVFIESGEYAGLSLADYLHLSAKTFPTHPADLPIIVKLIDSAQDLSLQVHPDDAYAQKHEGQCGKTEMWYVLDAQPGAVMICGFNGHYSRAQVEEACAANRLAKLCAWYPVHPGDVFFIPAGTIHAIGAGIVLAEVQQNSNITYRIDDYGRADKNGQKRPLHLEKALSVMTFSPAASPLQRRCRLRSVPGVNRDTLWECPYFSVYLLGVNGHQTMQTQQDRYTFYTCLAGHGMLSSDAEMLPVIEGDTFAAPPSCAAFTLVGNMVLLEVQPGSFP